jgi:hypothetical protein
MLKRNLFTILLFVFGQLLLSQAAIAQEREVNPFDIGSKPAPSPSAPSNGGTPSPSNQNPFDIQQQQSGTTTQISAPADTTTKQNTSNSVNDNPFDIKPAVVTPTTSSSTNVVEAVEPASQPIASITKPNPAENSQSFLFILTFSTMLILTILVTLSRDLIQKTYNAMFNETSLKALHRDKGPINTLMYNLLYGMFVINLGIFAFLCVRQFFLINGSQWLTLLACVLSLGLVVVCKHGILNAMMSVFPIKKDIDLYNFTILVFGIMMGCILAPLNIVLAYTSPEMSKKVALGIGITLLVFFSLRYIRSLLLTTRFIATNALHYVLYIMAFEVAPVVIVVKLFLIRFSQLS